MKICVAFPSGEMVHYKFVLSLVRLLAENANRHDVKLANCSSSRIAYNRNTLVEQAQSMQADYILFIDADMVVPSGAMDRLISHQKDIVCATASRRHDGMDGKPIGIFLQNQTDELVEMKIVGLPFMLIDMKVFEKLQRPYFAEPVADGDVVPEDVYFCQNVRAAGYEIWCDKALSNSMGHIGSKVYVIENKSTESNVINLANILEKEVPLQIVRTA